MSNESCDNIYNNVSVEPTSERPSPEQLPDSVLERNAKLFVHAEQFINDCLRTSTDKHRTIKLIHDVLTHLRYSVGDDAIYTPFSERTFEKLYKFRQAKCLV